MTLLQDGMALRQLQLGLKVDRAADTCAGTGTPGDPMFTVNGLCAVTAIIGVCTTTHGGSANTLSFEFNPDAATGTDSAITGTTDLGTASVVGDVAVVVGAPATGPLGGHVAVNVLGSTAGRGIALNDGVIGLVSTAGTGAWRWILFYIPIDDGAYITAVAV